MTTQPNKKPIPVKAPKPDQAKAVADHIQFIQEFQQEIQKLSQMVIELQKSRETESMILTLPRSLYNKANKLLADYTIDTGNTLTLTEIFCDAFEIYLWADDENKKLEKAREVLKEG